MDGVVELGSSVLSWIEEHDGLAAWVQAVGSVMAILAAVCIANHQSRVSEFLAALDRHKGALLQRAILRRRSAGLRTTMAILADLASVKNDEARARFEGACARLKGMELLSEVGNTSGVASDNYPDGRVASRRNVTRN